jgi:putative transcriptional regulator
MSDAFNRIREGLEQAIAHTAGEPVDVILHHPELPDVKAIRERTGLTQAQFASRCRISVGTLRHWERGDRHPQGPALALLRLVERHPGLAMETLGTIQFEKR